MPLSSAGMPVKERADQCVQHTPTTVNGVAGPQRTLGPEQVTKCRSVAAAQHQVTDAAKDRGSRGRHRCSRAVRNASHARRALLSVARATVGDASATCIYAAESCRTSCDGATPRAAEAARTYIVGVVQSAASGHEEHLSNLQRLAQGQRAQQSNDPNSHAWPPAAAAGVRQQRQLHGAHIEESERAGPAPPWAQPSFLPSLARYSSGARSGLVYLCGVALHRLWQRMPFHQCSAQNWLGC